MTGASEEAVELNGWAHKYPDEPPGGMQPRGGLARAIAADPAIPMRNEPFSALDPLIRRQLQDKFMALSAEMRKATLFIAHDLDAAIRIGQRIAIMKDGGLVQVGTLEDIVATPANADPAALGQADFSPVVIWLRGGVSRAVSV